MSEAPARTDDSDDVRSEGSRDFLGKCVAAAGGNALLEQIKEKGAETVLSLFRLMQNGAVHAIDNQAVRQAADQAASLVQDFAQVVGGNVAVSFLDDTVFVCGQLMRA